MRLNLRAEDEARRERLADIYEHVGEIAKKITAMHGDPLPQQLDRSIPAYLETLQNHLKRLRSAHCSVVVAGKSRPLAYVSLYKLDGIYYQYF